MNREQARQLVRETFTNSFDRDRFRRFIKELVNRYDESKASNWNSQFVKDAFKPHVQRYERLGTYSTPEDEKIDILVVYLTQDSKLERARTALRDFVADHLKTRDEKDCSLVAFVSPSEESWRFSLVKMEYETKVDEKGKVGVSTNLTPAKRSSYLVGAHEQCHTAQSRFLSLLQNTSDSPSLSNIEEAFSVETVTKEFFGEYARLFEDTEKELSLAVERNPQVKADFDAKSVSTVDLAKKLLGQIVFLYFIQKKGWLGVPKGMQWGEGPRDFLRQTVTTAICEHKHLFDDVLEPLFYDTLATDRGHDAWCATFRSRIPFLNGGLFEPLAGYAWKETEINLPNSLFTNEIESGDFRGTGILDVFDRYNFTVNESEPLEKEVAIDPEMLGKVFENLIEDNRRKGLGAFYTPREIVHHMCQESLVNFLDTKLNVADQVVTREDLDTLIRQGEQAAHYEAARRDGTTSYERRLPEAVERNAKAIDEALKSITVCDPAVGSGAFPVGMMTEIVRARVTLTPYFNDVIERTPYYFKRHAIQNSLYGVDLDPGAVEIAKLRLWLSLVVDEDDVQQIKPLPNLDYKIVYGNSLHVVEKGLFNEEIINEIERLKPLFFNESRKVLKESYKQEIDALIARLLTDGATFDFQIYFSERFHDDHGFDVVIMNPPYGAEFTKAEKDRLKLKYAHLVERIPNSFLYFMGLAYEIARNKGTVTIIEPNEFLFQIYMTKARRFFLTNTQILYAINAGEDIFKAIVPTCIVAFQKHKLKSYPIPVADLRLCSLKELPGRLSIGQFELSSDQIVLSTPNSIFSFDLKSAALVNRLVASCLPFESFCDDIANGISTSCDDRYIIHDEFAIQRCFEEAYLKPCIRGGQINRFYCPERTGDSLLYITDEFDSIGAPNIYDYLLENKSLLIRKCVEKKSGTRKWYVLFRSRYRELFCAPKILIRQTADRIIAAPDSGVGYFCIDSVNIARLIPSNAHLLRLMIGLLNSKVVNFFYREISQEGGRVLPQVKPQRIRALPIPSVSLDCQTHIELIVDQIVEAKSKDANADVTTLAGELDELCFTAYGLSEDERFLVQKMFP